MRMKEARACPADGQTPPTRDSAGVDRAIKFSRQVQLPHTVCGEKIIIGDRRLLPTLGLGPPRPVTFGAAMSCRRAYCGKSSRMASWKSAGSTLLMVRMVGNRSWQMTSWTGGITVVAAGTIGKQHVTVSFVVKMHLLYAPIFAKSQSAAPFTDRSGDSRWW